MADALRRYWLPLALMTAVLLAGIFGAASNYGEAQTASDVSEFKRVVPASEVSDYKLAALIDLLFAAGYGLLALIARSGLATKAGRGLRAARIGCWCVFIAAALDEIENVFLLWNLGNHSSIGEFAIDAMTTVGKAKWISAIFGLGLVAAGLLIRSLWPTVSRTDVRDWLRLAAKPYSTYLGLVVLLVLATLAHLRWAAALLLVPLLGCGVWLNRIVRESRRQAGAGSGNDLGPARLLLTFIQLACGTALFKWGMTEDSRAATAGIPGFDAAIVSRDVAAVFGLALLIMSFGSVISELRQNTRFQGRRAMVLFIVAVVLSAGGALVGASTTMLVLLAGAILAGEVATELAAEDLRRSGPESRSLAERLGLLGVVEVVGVIALVGMGADPAHALGIAAVLTVVVVLALLDGDVLYVVFLVAVLTILVTAPYEVDIDDDLRPVAGEPYILVLGDSYASGEGAQEYLPGTNEIVPGPATKTSVNECRQAPTAWGFELARLAALDAISNSGKAFPTRVLFLACSGAVSENIDTEERLGRGGKVHGPAELALYKDAVERLNLDPPALVLVGIGGNDGGFGDLGKTCVGPGNCAEVAEQFLRNRPDRLVDPPPEGQSESLVDIADDLREAFSKIRDVVGEEIPVVATSYPEPVAIAGRRCAGALLETEERIFINGFARELNQQVRAAAEDAGVSFMNISDALARGGSQLCADGPTPAGLNFIAFGSKGGTLRDSLNPKNWGHNSLHPSVEGHAAFAGRAHNWFEKHWPLDARVVDDVRTSSIDSFLETLAVQQCVPQQDRSCSVEHDIWLTGGATELYRGAILPLGALVFALFSALMPLVVHSAAPNAGAPPSASDPPAT